MFYGHIILCRARISESRWLRAWLPRCELSCFGKPSYGDVSHYMIRLSPFCRWCRKMQGYWPVCSLSWIGAMICCEVRESLDNLFISMNQVFSNTPGMFLWICVVGDMLLCCKIVGSQLWMMTCCTSYSHSLVYSHFWYLLGHRAMRFTKDGLLNGVLLHCAVPNMSASLCFCWKGTMTRLCVWLFVRLPFRAVSSSSIDNVR